MNKAIGECLGIDLAGFVGASFCEWETKVGVPLLSMDETRAVNADQYAWLDILRLSLPSIRSQRALAIYLFSVSSCPRFPYRRIS